MKYFIVILLAFFLFSCSASKEVKKPEEAGTDEKYDESFDPTTLNDDDIIIAKHEEPETPNSQPINEVVTNENDKISYREANGFRVQIIATQNIETATLIEQEAKDLFNTMEHKVYLIFEQPLYKVRVGDVTDRNDAEEIRDMAKDYGYREAFIVPSKVNIPDVKTY